MNAGDFAEQVAKTLNDHMPDSYQVINSFRIDDCIVVQMADQSVFKLMVVD